MAQVSVFEQLRSAETNRLHDLHDEICRMGIETATDFPQIVAFGLQNAGKSSVLEAITQIHFPVDAETCTRFATEIILSRGPERRVKVSVIFASATRPAKIMPYTSFKKQDLPEIIEEAKEIMRISDPSSKLSNDVLRVEIEGPTLRPLRLVDLPGLFLAGVATQPQRNKWVVNKIIQDYLTRQNSIILLVVAANHCYEEQAALHRLKTYDPEGGRTIGVITHPDHVAAEDKDRYISMAQNEQCFHKLKLGWHVLKNKADGDGTKRTASSRRDEIESKFLERSEWSVVPESNRGVAMLRQKIKNALYQQTQKSMQAMVADLELNLLARERELVDLGPARPNPQDMRSYLVLKASEFQILSRDAILGHYTGLFFRDRGDEARLRAQLQRYNAAFDYVFKEKGATHTIVEHNIFFRSSPWVPSQFRDLLETDPYCVEAPQTIGRDKLSARLSEKAAAYRGLELPGGVSECLALELFMEASAKWKDIARRHAFLALYKCRDFICLLLEYLTGPALEGSTTDAILRIIVDPFLEECEILLADKIAELVEPYEEGYAIPAGDEFLDSVLQKKKDVQKRKSSTEASTAFEKGTQFKKKDTPSAGLNSNAGFDPNHVIAKMETHYEMSRRTFTDNVINLALERCLVRRIPGMFTPAAVSDMTDTEVIALALDSVGTQRRREDIKKEIGVFEEAVKLCRKYRFGKPSLAVPRQKQGGKALSMSQGSQTGPASLSPSTKPASLSSSDKDASRPLQKHSKDSNDSKECSKTESNKTESNKTESNKTESNNIERTSSDSSHSDRNSSETVAKETVAPGEDLSVIACESNAPKMTKSSTGAADGKAESSPRAAKPDDKKTSKSIFSTYDPNLFKGSPRSDKNPFYFNRKPESNSAKPRPTMKPVSRIKKPRPTSEPDDDTPDDDTPDDTPDGNAL